MIERPDAQDLLLTARDLLVKKLLPALPAALRYEALMAANAMAIAARESELGAGAARQELASLASLLQEANTGSDEDEAVRLALNVYRKRLAAQIRAGKFDDAPIELTEHLVASARAQLAITNPKLLSAKASS